MIQCDAVRNLRYLYDSVCNLETSELTDINIITVCNCELIITVMKSTR